MAHSEEKPASHSSSVQLACPQGVVSEAIGRAGGSVVDETLVQAVRPEESIGVIAAPAIPREHLHQVHAGGHNVLACPNTGCAIH